MRVAPLLIALVFSAACRGPNNYGNGISAGGDAGGDAAVVRGGEQGVMCVAGQTYTVACGALGLGTCSGDPVLSVCLGSIAVADCTRTNAIESDDDTLGLCPGVTLTCPSSGLITIAHNALRAGNDYSCVWALLQGEPQQAGD